MIATARGLAMLAAIALALAVALLVTGRGSVDAVDRAVVPGFDASKVSELEVRHGSTTTRLRRAGDDWRIEDPPGIADPATVDAIITALRGGRWHRHAKATAIGGTGEGQARGQIRVNGTTLVIGPSLPGTGQTWIVRGDEALLVDSWVANALVPDPLELRVRHPLDCTAATAITATTSDGSVRIENGRLVEPKPLWLDERWLRALADACAQIEIRSLDGRAGPPGDLQITANGNRLVQTGTCTDPRYAYVDTPSGGGCVDASALDRLRGALRPLLAPTHELIDVRPLPLEPAKLTLPDGSVLELAKRPRIGDVDADPDQVRALVAALRTRGEGALPRPPGKPFATITAVAADGTAVTLELFERERAIGRAGEPGVVRVSDDAWATITRPSAVLRDPTRWREDATTLSSLTIDGVTYTRGAVLGEWTREPAGKVDAALVDALVETVATVRAPAGPPPRRVAHRLTVTFTPPAGAATTHAIELALPAGDGCPARVDGVSVVLPLPLCTAAIALASQR